MLFRSVKIFIIILSVFVGLLASVSAEVICGSSTTVVRTTTVSGAGYGAGSSLVVSVSSVPIAPIRRVEDAPIAPPAVMVIPSRMPLPYRAYRSYYPTTSGEYNSTLQYNTKMDGSGLETVKWSGQATSSQTSGYTPVNSRPQERKLFGVKFTPETPTHNVGEYYRPSTTITTTTISAGKSGSISLGK